MIKTLDSIGQKLYSLESENALLNLLVIEKIDFTYLEKALLHKLLIKPPGRIFNVDRWINSIYGEGYEELFIKFDIEGLIYVFYSLTDMDDTIETDIMLHETYTLKDLLCEYRNVIESKVSDREHEQIISLLNEMIEKIFQ